MNVMAIGAHPDDIEFGCSGTLMKHKERGCLCLYDKYRIKIRNEWKSS